MSDAEARPPSRLSRLIGIAGILSTHAFALTCALFALVKIVPAYIAFFEFHNASLPVPTQRIVVLSDFSVAFWFLLFPLVMLLDAAVVFGLGYLAPRKRRLLAAYSHVCLSATCALLIYIGAWLTHPVYATLP